MYYLNEKLIRNVYRLFGMTQRQFSEFALDSQQLYPQRLTRFHRLLVIDVIKIANATHIPIRHFFTKKKPGHLYMSKKDLVIEDNWTDITINKEGLKRIYETTGYDFDKKEIMQHLQIDTSCFWRWINVSFTMKTSQLCDLCNEFGIDLADIITDTNDFTPTATTAHREETLLSSNARLERRMKSQDDRIDNLEKTLGIVIKERDVALDEAAKAKAQTSHQKTEHDADIPVCSEDVWDSKWKWQAKKWKEENIPSLTQFIGYCNANHYPTLSFLKQSNNYEKETHDIITLDYMAYTMLAKSLGINESPEEITITKFIHIVEQNGLTPACCITDNNSHYPITFPDLMVRALGSAGIVVNNSEISTI